MWGEKKGSRGGMEWMGAVGPGNNNTLHPLLHCVSPHYSSTLPGRGNFHLFTPFYQKYIGQFSALVRLRSAAQRASVVTGIGSISVVR